MTLDEVAGRLFATHDLSTASSGAVHGGATSAAGTGLAVVGIAEGRPVGLEAAGAIAAAVLDLVEAGGDVPLVVLVASQSQEMSRRDELLGLNEHLAHLTKVLALAAAEGHRTVGVLYGAAAAGAFIATALATEILVAVPGAEPSVMDLPSMARVTRLPVERLQEMASTTPIFAPGIGPLSSTGAVSETWSDDEDWRQRLDGVLSAARLDNDVRGALGAERRGRLLSGAIAERVRRAARESA